jgi:hypothetical protein
MCYIDEQKNKYSVLTENVDVMVKFQILIRRVLYRAVATYKSYRTQCPSLFLQCDSKNSEISTVP